MNPNNLPVHEQVDYWRAEALRQKARVVAIKRGYSDPNFHKSEWGLPNREIQVFQILMTAKSEWVSRGVLIDLVYSDFEQQHGLCTNTIETHVSKLKSKLSKFGVRVETARYQGYRIHPDDRARIRFEAEAMA